MTEPIGDTFTIYLDSGAGGGSLSNSAGITYLPGVDGVPCWSNFSVQLSVPLRLNDPTHWFVSISEAIYRTPDGSGLSPPEDLTTSSVFIYVDCILATIFNNNSLQLISRLPAPAFPGTLDVPTQTYTISHYEQGSWPVPYTQTTTVIPWCQVNAASLSKITVLFADNKGRPIASSLNDTAYPFSIGLTFKYFGSKSF